MPDQPEVPGGVNALVPHLPTSELADALVAGKGSIINNAWRGEYSRPSSLRLRCSQNLRAMIGFDSCPLDVVPIVARPEEMSALR